MKKVLLTIISFFIFVPFVSARTAVNNLTSEYYLNIDGSASVTSSYEVINTGTKQIGITIPYSKDITISDIHITSDICDKEYVSGDGEKCTYKIENDSKSTKLVFGTDISKINVSYKLNNFIVLFKDQKGILFDFLTKKDFDDIAILNIVIKGYKPLSMQNTSFCTRINGDIKVTFNVNNYIEITGKNLSKNSFLSIIASLSGTDYTSSRVSNDTYEVAYEMFNNNSSILYMIKNINPRIKTAIIIVCIIILIVICVRVIIRNNRIIDEYYGIESFNKVHSIDYKVVPVYKGVPCNYDIYKVAFIAGYYGMIKNRSDLIGALLLKYTLEGKIKINRYDNVPGIDILPGQFFNRKLDKDLYDILLAASNYNSIKGNRLINYTRDHYLRIMTWFNMGFNESINDEYGRNNIKKVKRGKKLEFVLGENIYQMGLEIAGVKNFLIDINHQENDNFSIDYEYMLVLAELLGIGRQVAEEILRKKPDDPLALQLLNVENNKELYKDVYQTALGPYRKLLKSQKRSGYDPDIENLLKGNNTVNNNKLF